MSFAPRRRRATVRDLLNRTEEQSCGAAIVDCITYTTSGGGTGTASGTARNAASGCYRTDVTNVSASPLVFDGSEPLNGFNKGVDATPDEDCLGSPDDCG